MFFNNFINLSYQKDFLILIIGFSLIILCQTIFEKSKFSIFFFSLARFITVLFIRYGYYLVCTLHAPIRTDVVEVLEFQFFSTECSFF